MEFSDTPQTAVMGFPPMSIQQPVRIPGTYWGIILYRFHAERTIAAAQQLFNLILLLPLLFALKFVFNYNDLFRKQI